VHSSPDRIVHLITGDDEPGCAPSNLREREQKP
jgi:hypothetical protein